MKKIRSKTKASMMIVGMAACLSFTGAILAEDVVFLSEADSYVNQNSGGSNYGTSTTMEVRSTTSGIPDRNRRSFAEYDVSSIPSGATILSATVRWYMETAPSASRSYRIHRVTANWVETSITWNNQPAVAGSPTDTIATGTTSGVWLQWDVTSDVAGYISGTYSNYGWRVRDQTESSATDYRSYFRTREYTGTTYDPQLAVSYVTPTPTPTPITPTPTATTTPTPEGYHTPIPTPSSTPFKVIAGKGYATYYLLGDEDDLMDVYQDIPNSGVDPGWDESNMNCRLDVIATGNDVNVYLDEWENGYGLDEDDPYNTADAKWCVYDGTELDEGDVLILWNTDTYVTGSEGVDGGDVLYVTNAPLNVVRTVWPDYEPGTYMAGSWELYPIQHWQNTYIVPVGADTRPPQLPFEHCYLFVQGFNPNTRVVIDDPFYGGTEVDTIITKGENIIYPDPAGSMMVHQGTTVVGTFNGTSEPAPLQAGIFTSQNGVYDSRLYTLTPTSLLGYTYHIPAASMQFPIGEFSGRNVENTAYIYAFQDDTDFYVETAGGTLGPINIDQGDVYYYVLPQMPRGIYEGDYATKIYSDNPWKKIWVLVSGDDNNPDLDYGYQGLFPQYYGRTYYLPYAPSNPTHITPLYDDTIFYVDWDGGWTADTSFTLDRLETRYLFPPSWTSPTGYDGTGAHIWATKKFPLHWAQDNTERTPGPENDNWPPDLDYGFTLLPLFWHDPFLGLIKEVDPEVLSWPGGTVYFTVTSDSFYYTVYNFDMYDFLPPGFDYQTGTTTITFTDGTPTSYDDPAWDGGTDPQMLFWDLNHTLPPYEAVTFYFSARTDDSVNAGWHMNRAQAFATDLASQTDPNCNFFRPEDWAFIYLEPEVCCPVPLYLHPDGSDPDSARDLDRVAPTSFTSTVETINNGQTIAFFCIQTLESDLIISDIITTVGHLYLQNPSGTPDITATLAFSHQPDFATYTVLGSDTINDITTGGWRDFVMNIDETVAEGNFLTLRVSEGAGGSDSIELVYDSQTYYSMIEVSTTTYSEIDWARAYDDGYPGGTEDYTYEGGDSVYFRTRVSSPFGNDDISDCRITIVDPQGTTVVDDVSMEPPVGYDSKIYEYPFTTDWANTGIYDVTVEAWTGTEQQCFDGKSLDITTEPPTAVTLKEFLAEGYDGLVAIFWETGAEWENLGFHLHRSLSPEGPYQRLTDQIILGLGSSPSGARYLFIDRQVENGTVYYYKLEDIDYGGESTFYGPVEALPRTAGGEFSYDPDDYRVVIDNGIPGPTPPLPSATPSPLPTAYSLLPIIDSGDYDGDGVSEIALFRPASGLWCLRELTRCFFGQMGDIPASGDYDGDGTAEIALFRPQTGLWAIKDLSRSHFGLSGDIPVPADYDGDGLSDIALFRSACGLWVIREITRFHLGEAGDLPRPADYDGNGGAEAALFRPASGLWAVRGISRLFWGTAADLPVPSDYDGDGIDDIAVFHSPSGRWAIRNLTGFYFGTGDDLPVPAAYLGPGGDEAAVFRPESGLWAVRSLTRLHFGGESDIPATR